MSLLPFYHSLFCSFLCPIPLFRTLHPLFYLHPSISLSVSSLTHLLSLLLFPSPVFCTHPAHPFFLLLIYSYVCTFYLSYWRSPVLHLEFFSLFVPLKRSRIQSDSRALCIRRLSRTAAVLCCRGDVDRSAAGHKDTRPEIIFSFVSVSRLLLYRGREK